MSISQLTGRVQAFAQYCYDTYDLTTLEAAAAQPGADADDCAAWGISPDEWIIAVAVALNDRYRQQEEAEGTP